MKIRLIYIILILISFISCNEEDTKEGEIFAEDILFLADFSPIFCESEDFNHLLQKDTLSKGKEQLNRFVKTSLQILKIAPKALNKAKPLNSFQKDFKKKLSTIFKKYDIENIDINEVLESKEVPEKLEKFYAEVMQLFNADETKNYIADKLGFEIRSNNESIEDLVNKALLHTDRHNEKEMLSYIHQIAMNNQKYKEHFESGCLKLFKESIESNIGN